jgi:GAF domain-containing protein
MPSTDPIDLLSAWLGEPGGHRDAVLRVLLELAVRVAGAEEGSLLLLDGATRELVFATTVGDRDSAEALRGQRIPRGRGLVGLAAQTHEVQIGSPTYGDVKQAAHRAEAGGPAWTLAAPVLIHDELVGVVTAVTFSTERPLGSDSAELFSRVAAASRRPWSRSTPATAATALVARAARDPAKLARIARVLAELEAVL